MKKIIPFIFLSALVFSFAACKKSPQTDVDKNVEETLLAAEAVQDTTAAEEETVLAEELPALVLRELEPAEVLVVYFDERDGVKAAADAFCEELGCASFEIVPAEPYPENESEKLARAKEEYNGVRLPVLEGTVENMNDYSTLIVVFPEFGGNMPMAVRTFLEDYDLRNISLVPVCICADAGPEVAFEQLSAVVPSGSVYSGLELIAGADIVGGVRSFMTSPLSH